MAEAKVINPDLDFVKEIINSGGESLKKCFQCSTCTVVCNVTPEDRPFPRKEMIYAQWGLKDKLLNNPDIWLCHNCDDCTKYCPRGAKPGDVLAVMRKKSIEENAVPGFMGKIVTEPKMTLAALAIPFILFLAVLGLTGHLGIPDGDIVYSKFFPIRYIEVIFISAVILAGISYLSSLSRFWNNISKGSSQPYSKGFFPALIETLVEFLKHSRFGKCEANAGRKNGHLLVFYAFAGLAITTIWITIYYYLPEPYKKHSPISLADPMKWLANISALALLAGTLLIVFNRLKNKGYEYRNSSFDWTFAGMILLLGVTGALTEIIRLMGVSSIAYPMYFVHLLFVFYVIAYFPYSKLAHMGYRTLAIAYSKMANRDIAV
ncbi:MAG: heterodisulfide reductase [Nitrospirae bacterium CG_4_10_14_3_um_filter_44_29]|nr:heterodisulfide reductase [Nitrospirota bacterium]OIO27795.1 MAG: heterodisulfide reductase [Nitrospirae bacterium CG1_02_44_142]PIP70325.1 MAG: heterodisulfide reductase [Nitrospirae bacterium CG22_combo_CG10-13_8_21_14_all_44_11]PIV40043.1 MAG: heterodisulfide reductase [Nitrospirae bacterium CG02_land_8_20_14_3_00_44_33]PIV67320.1 MAG: heterodisulfide reductase [Nitrospirae bacterium CG01_land_8_20_14_3_00_44_22]PIW90246.1 MAG: heterodisulfide reductase [Nitrospirae bacterium CG_4_8_14_3